MKRMWNYFSTSSKVSSEVSTKQPSEVSTKQPSEVSTKQPSEVSTKQPSEVSTKQPSEYYEYVKTKKNCIVVIRPRGGKWMTGDDKQYTLSIMYETGKIFDVYKRIIDLYKTAYLKVSWVIQTEDTNVTMKYLKTGGVTDDCIYIGEEGLEQAKADLI